MKITDANNISILSTIFTLVQPEALSLKFKVISLIVVEEKALSKRLSREALLHTHMNGTRRVKPTQVFELTK